MNDVGTKYPLSDTQYAVYAYCKAHLENAVYQICMKFGSYHGIDVRRLKFAVETVIDRHPIFKVRIVNYSNGAPAMQRNDNEPPIVDIFDAFQQFVSIDLFLLYFHHFEFLNHLLFSYNILIEHPHF